jgi:hypothetical protein
MRDYARAWPKRDARYDRLSIRHLYAGDADQTAAYVEAKPKTETHWAFIIPWL